MLDTLEVARSLTDADFTAAQADAITNAIRRAAEHRDHVTRDQFEAGLANLRADIAAVEARLIRWMVGAALAAAGIGVAILRLWPSGS